ncbi:TIGR02234 family membrane protein [Dietzia alimentaria]|uniref:TIGR02234 family membrane protein n=1 Tax=Dietzia alimentaria TaxID=665550 RepID=UPI001EE65063|nr:TIGR02234 family membrane protein [Dietzia alimentaria]
MSRRVRLQAPMILLVIAAVLLWVASRMVWLDVVAFNDQSGEARRALSGGDWQPALVPLALGSLAAIAAVALVRGVAARAVGAVIALLGAATGTLMFSSLGDVDQDRVHTVITSDEGQARTDAGPGAQGSESVPQWSNVTEVSTRSPGPVLTGVGAVALLAAGLVVMIWPARPVERDGRYVTPAARREEAAATGEGDGEGRDLWRELDDGRDPTG